METAYNEEALIEQLKEAKKNGDKKAIFNIATELLRPEARECLDIIMKKPETTQNHYGDIMHACSVMKDYRYVFLNALVAEGYDPLTAEQVRQLI